MSVEIGSYLRQAREALGMTLDQVQEKTKIQKSFLIAIENGEFHKLPSPFYVRTYLRSYANCVKVEPHHILRQYRKMDQAERLTGVHKAVSESDLSQTMRFPTQATAKMPAIGPGSGPHRSVSQETMAHRQQPATGKTMPRISLNTALTAAKSETSKLQALRDREMARRDLGYQRNTGMMRTMPPRPAAPDIPPRPAASEMPPVPPAKQPAPSPEPLMKQVPDGFGDGFSASMPPRRSREVAKQNTQKMSAVGSVGPQPVKPAVPDAGLEPPNPPGPLTPPLPGSQPFGNQPLSETSPGGIPSRSAAGKGATGPMGTTGSLSRSARSRRDTIPPTQDPFAASAAEAAAGESGTFAQETSRSATLSRSAVKGRKQAKGGGGLPIKRKVVAAVAALVLCGSLGWGVAAILEDDPKSEKADSNPPQAQANPPEGKTAPQVQPASKGTLEQAQKGENTNHYRLKGTDQVVIEFQAVGGKCWIQIRNSPETGTSVLEDVTLKKGEPWSYSYKFEDQTDLWIAFGDPANVNVKVNGSLIHPVTNVHIKKVD